MSTCAKCGLPMRHNVPRLGDAGGWVHADNGSFDCPRQRERLLDAWADKTGCSRDDARVVHPEECGWPADFRTFQAGWVAAAKAAEDTALSERPRMDLSLTWGTNTRDGRSHIEWHAPCGCAYHPQPSPHVHHCPAHWSMDRKTIEVLASALKKIAPELVVPITAAYSQAVENTARADAAFESLLKVLQRDPPSDFGAKS